jgi:nucleotide-binding universal stress UspA family protein
MSAEIIVSYDGTPNDDDALALGKALAAAGASMALAYVRHSREFDPGREQLAQHDAARRLQQGADWLGNGELPRHVVISASTGEGLAKLAADEGATLIVFGSDYRTSPGHAEPGNTAQHLLEGGRVAVAVAAAGLRLNPGQIGTVAASPAGVDGAGAETAQALAAKLGATLIAPGSDTADLIVVGSQETAPPGTIALGGSARSLLNASRGSVLVVAQGTPVTL